MKFRCVSDLSFNKIYNWFYCLFSHYLMNRFCIVTSAFFWTHCVWYNNTGIIRLTWLLIFALIIIFYFLVSSGAEHLWSCWFLTSILLDVIPYVVHININYESFHNNCCLNDVTLFVCNCELFLFPILVHLHVFCPVSVNFIKCCNCSDCGFGNVLGISHLLHHMIYFLTSKNSHTDWHNCFFLW